MAFKPEEHLRQLKGQNYLDCVWRVVWVREEHPDAQIDTEVVYWDHDKQEIMVRAVVVLPKTGARAVAHCMCSQAEFKFGYSEKAETQAIGRALALLGYGTAFAGQDLDEGERVADSPLTPKSTNAAVTPLRPSQPLAEPRGHPGDADHTPAAQAPQTPAESFVEAAATALATQATGDRRQATEATVDPTAALRAEVVALCSVDGAALQALRTKAGGKMPAEWTEEQLRNVLPWLRKRVPRSTQLSGRIAAARTDEEMGAVLEDAQQAKDQRAISQVEYLGLHREAQTRKAALSGPLTAGAGLGVAS